MINGKWCYVSDISEERALASKFERKYIGTDSKGIMWFESTGVPIPYQFAVEIPEPRIKK